MKKKRHKEHKLIVTISTYRNSGRKYVMKLKDRYIPYYKTLRIEASKNIKEISVKRAYLNGLLASGRNHGSPHKIGIMGIIFHKHEQKKQRFSYCREDNKPEKLRRHNE